MITGKGPSARQGIFYFAESDLAAARIDNFKYQFITRPGDCIGTKEHPNMPVLTTLRLDPFEHTAWPSRNLGRYKYFGWMAYKFCRFVFVQL